MHFFEIIHNSKFEFQAAGIFVQRTSTGGYSNANKYNLPRCMVWELNEIANLIK